MVVGKILNLVEGQIGLEFGGIRVYTYSHPFYSAECGLPQYNLEYFLSRSTTPSMIILSAPTSNYQRRRRPKQFSSSALVSYSKSTVWAGFNDLLIGDRLYLAI